MNTKIISIFLIVLLTANLILFFLGKIKALTFWIIIIITALIAYKGIPYLRRKKSL